MLERLLRVRVHFLRVRRHLVRDVGRALRSGGGFLRARGVQVGLAGLRRRLIGGTGMVLSNFTVEYKDSASCESTRRTPHAKRQCRAHVARSGSGLGLVPALDLRAVALRAKYWRSEVLAEREPDDVRTVPLFTLACDLHGDQ